MGMVFGSVFVLIWAGSMAWVFLLPRLCQALAESEPVLYGRLMAPPVVLRRQYSPNEIRGLWQMLRFLWRRDFSLVQAPAVRRRCRQLAALLRVLLCLWAILLVLLVMGPFQ